MNCYVIRLTKNFIQNDYIWGLGEVLDKTRITPEPGPF